METSDQITQVWPIAAYFIILAAMLIFMMLLSHFLGPKGKQRAKNTPYESGIISVNDNKTRFTNHFFLYAIFFVIFDLETIFLFAWVIAFDEVGWLGFIEASIFIIVLLAALIYLIRIGALELKHRHQPFRETQLQRLRQADVLADKQASEARVFQQNKAQQ
ncbi:MAG: NADH-quinone oxidoreductase subunit A [Cognaticolwellia sp.]